MLNHYRVALSRIPFALAAALSLVVLFTPASGVPTAPPGTDKVVHFALFTALMITGLAGGGGRRPLALGLVVYAGLSEVLQAVLPLGRSGDAEDALVDVLGIVAGYAAFGLWRRLLGGQDVGGR